MSDVQRKFHDALDDALDRPIAFNPSFKRITASTVAGIFLSQAWYWSKRHAKDEGWFWKTQAEWEDETALSRSEQETARKHCLRVGVIEEKLKGVPATMYYRVNKEKVYELLGVQYAETKQTEIEGLSQSSFPANSQFAGNQQSDNYSNINKVSETSPLNPPSVGGLTEKELKQANAKVDAMIENGKKAKYQNREKMPETYLVFSDLYHELTKQEPTKRVFMDWMQTFEEWKQEGLQPDHIRAAWSYANRPEGGFIVGRPGSLTNTAVAMKSKVIAKETSAPKIDENEIERTRRMLAEKEENRQGAVPRPEYVERPRI